jgi:hypothetical protein
MQIKSKFKKGRLVDTADLPDKDDRDEFLVSYAIKNNLPIVIGKQNRWDELKYIDSNVYLLRLAPRFTFEVKGAEVKEVLVDETIIPDMIDWLKRNGYKICGGFKGSVEE